MWMQETSTVEYISLQTVFILIQLFSDLNCNMNGHHHEYFSVDIALCHSVEGAHDINCSQK